MIKIAALGIVIVILAVFLKGIKNEYGIYIVISGCIILLGYALGYMSGIIELVNSFKDYLSLDSTYILILMKMIGIAFIAEISSAICRDSGYGSVSGIVEMIGKLSILITSAPILKALLDTVFSIM